jgi:hypothetical protein
MLTIIGILFLLWNDRHTYAKADDPKGCDGAKRYRLPNGRSAGYDSRGNYCGAKSRNRDIERWIPIIRREKQSFSKLKTEGTPNKEKSINIQIQMMVRLMAESEPCLFHNNEKNLMIPSSKEKLEDGTLGTDKTLG